MQLAHLLTRSTSRYLKNIDLSGNPIGDEGAIALANSLATNRKLEQLAFWMGQI